MGSPTPLATKPASAADVGELSVGPLTSPERPSEKSHAATRAPVSACLDSAHDG